MRVKPIHNVRIIFFFFETDRMIKKREKERSKEKQVKK